MHEFSSIVFRFLVLRNQLDKPGIKSISFAVIERTFCTMVQKSESLLKLGRFVNIVDFGCPCHLANSFVMGGFIALEPRSIIF